MARCYLNRIMLHESFILLQWKFREGPAPSHDRVLLLKLSISGPAERSVEWGGGGGGGGELA